MSKMNPSSAVLPARYVDKNRIVQTTKSQRGLESDDETLSARESDATLTAEDSEKEIDSDSTNLDHSSSKNHKYVFKIKDEVSDSDEESNSKEQKIATIDAVIKQEPLSDHEDNIDETDNSIHSNLHTNVVNVLSSNENESGGPSCKQLCNSVDYQYLASNVRIKKEKDSCAIDTCDMQTPAIISQEEAIENEHTNNTLKCSLVKEKTGNDSTTLRFRHLELSHSNNESVKELYSEGVIDKSRKVSYVSNSPPIVKIENLNSHEANSDVLSSSGYESETCMENTKTPPICSADSAFKTVKSMNETDENNRRQSNFSINDCNISESSCSNSKIENFKVNEINFPRGNFLNSEAVENENDAYLYSSEAEKMDVSFPHFNSTNLICNTSSHSAMSDYSKLVSQNSSLHAQIKIASNHMSPKEKLSSILENDPVKCNIAAKEKMSNNGTRNTTNNKSGPTSANSKISSDRVYISPVLIEYCKCYLNFSKNELEKCLNFVNSMKSSKSPVHPIFLCSRKVKITNAERADIFPTVNTEILNTSCVNESVGQLSNSESSQTATIMTTEEKSTVNSDTFKIGDQNKCSQLSSAEKNDSNSTRFARPSEISNYVETTITDKDKSNIKRDIFKVCDQNMHSEALSSDNNAEGEIPNIDSKLARIVPEVTSFEASMTRKEKSNVKCNNDKVCDQNTYTETQSSENNEDEENSIRFNRLMTEIMNEASQNNECFENIPCHVQPSIVNTAPIKIKQEKIDSFLTEPLTSDIKNTSVQSGTEVFSGENNALIPSIQDLQSIIHTSVLLNNPLSSSNSLNSPPKDVNIKIEPPEIEEITLDGDISVNVNGQQTRDSAPVIPDDDIKVLIIKKRKNSTYRKTLNRAYNFLTKRKKDNNLKTLTRLSSRSGCTTSIPEMKVEKNRDLPNTFGTVNGSYKSDTFKIAAQLHGMKSTEINCSQPNTDDTVKTVSNNTLKDIVIKIENTGDYSTECSKGYENESINSFLSKRTVYFLNQPNVSFNVFNEQKQNTQNEPPSKKVKNTPVAYEENQRFSTNYSFGSNQTSDYFACKRKMDDEIENKKKIKSEEQKVETWCQSCDGERKLAQASNVFERVVDSVVPLRKHTLAYSAISLPLKKANQTNSSTSDRNSSNQSGTLPNAMCSKTFISENNCQNPPKLTNEISSCVANIQSAQQIEMNHLELQTNHKINSTNVSVISPNTRSKMPISENKNQNSSKSRNETDTQQRNFNPEKHKSNDNISLLRLNPRGGGRISSSKIVGKNYMDINDFPSLILEWNANWLIVQRETKRNILICEPMHVKDLYEDELDYYNTYFPLHLLSIWLGISDSWKGCPPCFNSSLDSQFEKPSFVKISLVSDLDIANYHHWPKREDIVLCNTTKSDGSEENIFGRVCNIMTQDPPSDRSLKDKTSTLKRIKLELFCAELLDVVPSSGNVKVQILSNMRIAILQNDALQNLNNSMKEIILDPLKYISQWKFIKLCPNDNPAFEKTLKSILESVTSQAVKITIVDTPTSTDGIFAISQLTANLIKERFPVLIGLKSEESFIQLATSMKRFDPILAIKKREVNLPEELIKFTLEERSATSRDIFKGCHLTLTLLSSVFLGDFTSAFSSQNLTCILHEAHLCTETETALLLYYDVKNLLLLGNQEAQTHMHPILKSRGYDVSLFHRFCKVKYRYASF